VVPVTVTVPLPLEGELASCVHICFVYISGGRDLLPGRDGERGGGNDGESGELHVDFGGDGTTVVVDSCEDGTNVDVSWETGQARARVTFVQRTSMCVREPQRRAVGGDLIYPSRLRICTAMAPGLSGRWEGQRRPGRAGGLFGGWSLAE
jgi:hypothetical protein